MNIQEQFKAEFDKAFRWLELATDRARALQDDLEWTSELLEGPLYNILTKGNCNYIFRDMKWKFHGVRTVEDFRRWVAGLAGDFRKVVEGFEVAEPAEVEDRARLLEKAEAMQRAAELAYQIQNEQ
jgi:hypothetical protein